MKEVRTHFISDVLDIPLDEWHRLKAKREREQGILSLIYSMRAINATDEQRLTALRTEYSLSREQAQEKIKQQAQ